MNAPSKNDKNSTNNQAIIDKQDVSKLKTLIPNPAFDFDFKLDDFQARSILRLEQNQSVFASAPTSAGKTVIAQYAISLCLKHKKHVIYTSPIKALSNQKYREFANQFHNVGIITGDVTINKEAPVLIMTTEILRSMLYNNDEILHEVECVIFDEFHYIANESRGCVWEESIIFMPPEINMVFLSATMPNAEAIANWIASTKNRNVYIEINEKRPVPLLHSVYISNQIINIVGNDQKFNEEAYQKAQSLKPTKKEKKSPKEKVDKYVNLILNLQKNDLLPALLFIFTINGIEEKASMLIKSNINLLSKEESDHVINFFNQTIEKIPENDRNLPQIKEMIELLKKGIGIHHSGLFPILKETVEILLSEGYIKVILCTSTIGMGLNLPVRTCCFTSLKKFNGKGKDPLTLTEYQQMSGRAGRRGHDKFGTSLLCIDKSFPKKGYLQNIFCGKAENIKSQFQISFKMVLNSIHQDGKMEMQEIINNTFFQSENQPNTDRILEKIKDIKKKLSLLDHVSSCSMEPRQEGHEFDDQKLKPKGKNPKQHNDDDEQPEQNQKKKTRGKKKQLHENDGNNNDNDITEQKNTPKQQNIDSDDIEDSYFSAPIYDFACKSNEAISLNLKMQNNHKHDIIKGLQKGMMALFIERNACNICFIDSFDFKGKKKSLLAVKVYANGKVLICKGDEIKKLIFLTLPVENYEILDNKEKNELIMNFDPNTQLQTYRQIFNSKSKKFISLSNLLHKCLLDLLSSKCLMCKFYSKHIKTALLETNYQSQIQINKSLLNKKGNIEYQCYLNLLQEMDYIEKEDEHYILTPKGLVASDIFGHEIFSSELLFSDVFDDCSANDLAALCSCLVPHRKTIKNETKEELPSNLIDKVDKMNEIALFVKEKMSKNSIPFDENGFVTSILNTSTLPAVFSWVNGESFEKVMKKLPNMLEGHFVSVFTMERGLLFNFANAALKMGLDDLSSKFNEAADIINHDIISVRSIYLDDSSF